MPKISSERNVFTKAACIAAAVLLCLGGFFVFSGCENSNNSAKVDSISQNSEKVYFVKKKTEQNSLQPPT